MLPRVLIAALALALAGLFLVRLGDERGCRDAARDAFLLSKEGAGPPAQARRVAADVRAECDPERLATAAAGLSNGGHQEPALELARTAAQQAPESFTAWSVLAGVQGRAGEDPAEAVRRAQALNPLWVVPPPLRRSAARVP